MQTEQKLESFLNVSEAPLSNLARRLIQARDDERLRISRELHDNIGQRAVLLALGLDKFRQDLAADGLDSQSHQVSELLEIATELTTDIQQLSHDLHSTSLEHLGLRVALDALCQKMSSQRQIPITLRVDGLLDDVRPQVALCIFRVVQEALSNVAKHSHTSDAYVEVTRTSELIGLKIRDFGVGFDPSVTSAGIGLSTMRDRLLALGGKFLVQSSAGRGTEVLAQVELIEK